MEENRKLSPREREITNRETNRESSRTGAESRHKETPHKEPKKGEGTLDQHRADMDGNVGEFDDNRTRPTGEESALPGSGENKDIGTSSTGAGLGGNKGTGTRKKTDFQ